jgi:hypothetical protein
MSRTKFNDTALDERARKYAVALMELLATMPTEHGIPTFTVGIGLRAGDVYAGQLSARPSATFYPECFAEGGKATGRLRCRYSETTSGFAALGLTSTKNIVEAREGFNLDAIALAIRNCERMDHQFREFHRMKRLSREAANALEAALRKIDGTISVEPDGGTVEQRLVRLTIRALTAEECAAVVNFAKRTRS